MIRLPNGAWVSESYLIRLIDRLQKRLAVYKAVLAIHQHPEWQTLEGAAAQGCEEAIVERSHGENERWEVSG